MSKREPYKKEVVEKAVRESKTYSDVYRYLNVTINGGSYRWLKRMIKSFDLDTSHFHTRRDLMRIMTEKSNEVRQIDMYKDGDISNGERISGTKLRSFMTYHKIEMKCVACDLNRWLDKPIRLDVDHLDGNCVNNHISNLQYLCPNCHRQKTIDIKEDVVKEKKEKKKQIEKLKYSNNCLDCGTIVDSGVVRCRDCYHLSRLKIDWVSNEELTELVWKYPTSELSKMLGVSDVAISKRCKKYDISKPSRGYWAKIKSSIIENKW